MALFLLKIMWTTDENIAKYTQYFIVIILFTCQFFLSTFLRIIVTSGVDRGGLLGL